MLPVRVSELMVNFIIVTVPLAVRLDWAAAASCPGAAAFGWAVALALGDAVGWGEPLAAGSGVPVTVAPGMRVGCRVVGCRGVGCTVVGCTMGVGVAGAAGDGVGDGAGQMNGIGMMQTNCDDAGRIELPREIGRASCRERV